MTMMVAGNKKSDNHPDSLLANATENIAREPPPPGTEDVPLLESIGNSGSCASNAEPLPPGMENALPVQSSSNTMATSSSAIDDDYEEGEIADDDDDVCTLEYENISSEEESNIRERIAELLALDDEMRKIKAVTNNEQNLASDKRATINVGNEHDFEWISDEEDFELFLQRYEPVPKPKLLPPQRKRKVRSIRYSSSMRHVGSSSTNRKYDTRDLKRRAEKRKHEQMSARKSNIHRSRHKRRKQHMAPSALVNIADSTDSEQEYPLDRERLQAACNINAGKRKTDKENWDALKQKLKLQMQKRKRKQSETGKDLEVAIDEPMVVVADDEEEDDVLQLRQRALESKAQLHQEEIISLVEDPTPPKVVNEEQQLRLDALRSAFTKKHEKRLRKKQEERPYSPSDELFLLASPIEDEEDDEVQIIEKLPETVEIADSSSEEDNLKEINANPQCPEPPEFPRMGEMPLNTINDSSSSATIAVSSHDKIDAQNEESALIEPPPPPIIGDLQSKLPEEDDEETLRNQLLSKLSSSVSKPAPVSMNENRPMTPDSMGEEETEALRELILSRMHKKASRKQTTPFTPTPLASEVPQNTLSPDIPCDPVALPNEMEPLTVSIADHLPVPTESCTIGTPALQNTSFTTNQSKVQSNPNLITLIGKQKITRKKRKKSLSAASVKRVSQPSISSNQVLAIAVPRPSRTLIKAPIVQTPSPPLMVTTKKLVNNPNKLINLNAPVQITHSPRDQSALLETYVQRPVAKMIIQVGHSDSDSDPDYYPAPDPISTRPADIAAVTAMEEAFLRDIDNASPSRVMLESPSYSPTPTPAINPDDGASLPEVPTVDSNDVPFEQRLDQFLKTVRSKIDQSQAVAATVTTTVARVDEPTKSVARKVASTPMTASSVAVAGRGSAVRATRKPITAPAAPITPSAVRHLPKSAQLEYRRLVARMALLEKQKQQRISVPRHKTLPPHPLTKTITNAGPAESEGPDKNHEIIVTINRDRRDVVDLNSLSSNNNQHVIQQQKKRVSDPLVKRVLINNTVIAERENITPRDSNTHEVRDQQPLTDKDIALTEMDTLDNVDKKANQCQEDFVHEPEANLALKRLPSLGVEARLEVLKIAENRFEKHSQKFAQELQELIGTVEHAQKERQKQYDLENKVGFLKDKLAVLERALCLHKKRLDEIFPELQESHTKVMSSRKRSIELNNLCLSIGREVHGPRYSPPSSARTEIHEQLKVLTTETKRLKEMKKLSLEEFKELTAEQRRMQQDRKKHEIEEQLTKTVLTAEPPDQIMEPQPFIHDGNQSDTDEPIFTRNPSDTEVEQKLHTKSMPSSRSESPIATPQPDGYPSVQEAPAVLEGSCGTRFKKYTSPLASLKNQSALNIPDGVLCPYQMRGECFDQDCKFDHLK